MKFSEEQYKYGFWRVDMKNNFPPKSITNPNEYKHSKSVNVFCTQQNNLPLSEQKKLVQEWVDFLPQCQNLEYVWFSSRVNQELFDSACKLKKLKGLHIKWSGIKKLDKISSLKDLKYLYIGTSGSIENIKPLKSLEELEAIHLEAFGKITDFSVLSNLANLKFLEIEGSMEKKQKVDSFTWVNKLDKLIFFSAAAVNLSKKDSNFIFNLKNLKTLNWPFSLSDGDIKKLEFELPKLENFPQRNQKDRMKKLKILTTN